MDRRSNPKAPLRHAISERWPSTIRIALSGRCDVDDKLRLLPLAHQFLAKPCRAEQLEDTVARGLQLREELTQPAVRAIIGGLRQLPARPQVFARLQAAMARADASAREVARVIAADTALTVAIALTGGDDSDGCARKLAPSEVVGADYLASLESTLTWPEAEARARTGLERLAHESN